MSLANNKIIPLCALGLALVGGSVTLGSILRAHTHIALPTRSSGAKQQDSAETKKPAADPRLAVTVALTEAVRNGFAEATVIGNGRNWIRVTAKNLTPGPLRLVVPSGMIFRAGRSTVIAVREQPMLLAEGESATATAKTAALASSNIVAETGYELTDEQDVRLGPLLTYLQRHPEATPGAMQTAVLAITENLPLRAFAKFAEPLKDAPAAFATPAFKADTTDIVSALIMLRGVGIPDEHLALTIDPQLRIEAMIDPLSHAVAMKYYRIRDEWGYWKKELTAGDPSTRHYALYGIARFYPEVALQMLPSWVRETRTDPVYRISAVQALAETHRLEAVSTLRQLAHELGEHTELGRVAAVASDYVETNLNKPYVPVVPFRLTRLPEPIPYPLLESIPVLTVAN